VPRRQAWPIRRIGRRGVFLAMFGVIYLVVGGTVFGIESRRFSDIAPVIGPILDANAWGIMWVGCGVLAIITGLRRDHGSADGLGFGALLIPPAVWTVFYTASVVAYLATGGLFGRIASLSGVAVWSIVWFVVLLVSGWPEPRVQQPPDEGG
jgi:hypothetical protein